MLLGITTFGKRISPRFDCALGLLLVEIEGNEILGRKEESMKGIPGGGRVSFLVERGVQAVLTGGIRRCDYFAALDAGLTVHAGFMGEVEENLRRYLLGTLPRFGPGLDLSTKYEKRVSPSTWRRPGSRTKRERKERRKIRKER